MVEGASGYLGLSACHLSNATRRFNSTVVTGACIRKTIPELLGYQVCISKLIRNLSYVDSTSVDETNLVVVLYVRWNTPTSGLNQTAAA